MHTKLQKREMEKKKAQNESFMIYIWSHFTNLHWAGHSISRIFTVTAINAS